MGPHSSGRSPEVWKQRLKTGTVRRPRTVNQSIARHQHVFTSMRLMCVGVSVQWRPKLPVPACANQQHACMRTCHLVHVKPTALLRYRCTQELVTGHAPGNSVCVRIHGLGLKEGLPRQHDKVSPIPPHPAVQNRLHDSHVAAMGG